jgi:hypothetical protein
MTARGRALLAREYGRNRLAARVPGSCPDC